MSTNFLQNMLVLLCQFFGNYDATSNVGKFLEILSRQLTDLETALNDSNNILNVDTATGSNLEIFSDNLDLIRGSLTDSELRNIIKTEIRSNFSQGTHDEVREVAEVVLGEDALNGIVETYNRSDFSNEIAGIVLFLNASTANLVNIPEPTIEKTVAAGVRVYYGLTSNVETVLVQEPDDHFNTLNFVECGTFETSRQLGVLF